jgi:hypothetical protein
MSRPPTPIAILEARGSVRKNPKRYRERIAAQPAARGPLGAPPLHWITDPSCYYHARHVRWRGIWEELDGQLPSGMLKAQDRILIELLIPEIDKMREKPAEMKPVDKTNLVSMLAKLGMTPVDRMKVSGDGGKRAPVGASSGWEKFA